MTPGRGVPMGRVRVALGRVRVSLGPVRVALGWVLVASLGQASWLLEDLCSNISQPQFENHVRWLASLSNKILARITRLPAEVDAQDEDLGGKGCQTMILRNGLRTVLAGGRKNVGFLQMLKTTPVEFKVLMLQFG